MTLSSYVYRFRRSIDLPRAEVWELLAQTDHLNRAIGLAEIQFAPVSADSMALEREVSTRLAGQTLQYREFPFEWTRGEEYRVRRVFTNGPFREVNGGICLRTLQPDSTQLEIFSEIVPANAFGKVIAPVIARRFTLPIWSYCQRYLEQKRHIGERRPKDELLPPASGPSFNALQLQRALDRLRSQPVKAGCAALDERLVSRLCEFLRMRGDDEVGGIRPFSLARSWGAVPLEVLRVCLYATKAGLLNLSWNLMCPNCRVSKVETANLAGVTAQFHCDLCGVDYRAQFDRFVELKFKVHPAIREAITGMYCIAGPYVSPHVLQQRIIGPDQEASFRFPAPDVPLHLRLLRTNEIVEFDEPAHLDEKNGQLIYSDEGWNCERVRRPQGDEEITIRNTSKKTIVAVLEETEWDGEAVTAYYVTTMPEFRMLFGSEVLAPGQSVGVETLTLFFSDLKDSTMLYEQQGDALAYGAVRRHFDYLVRHIERNSGSVIKMIGDAVMAVFQTPENALQASLEIQHNLEQLNADLPIEGKIGIKIGLHCGPAIAINSNNQLDYFGRTVNIAARIGGLSHGGDIALSQAMLEDSAVRHKIESLPGQVENLQVQLKGIEGSFAMCRWCPAPGEEVMDLFPENA